MLLLLFIQYKFKLLKCFLFLCGLAAGPLKLMAIDGALRGRVCYVCLKTALPMKASSMPYI